VGRRRKEVKAEKMKNEERLNAVMKDLFKFYVTWLPLKEKGMVLS
jgi:hypothetical protein